MAQAKSQFPTMYELLSKYQVGRARRGRGVLYVTSGKKPKPFPRRTGLVTLSPEELLSVRAPLLHIDNGQIKGYQRKLDSTKAHKVARYITEHEDYMDTVGAVEISLTDNQGYASDGEHRIAGAIIANKPLRLLVTKRTWTQARELFTNQRYATPLSRNVTILNSDGVYDEYIQDAVTNPDHPWHNMISTAVQTGGGTNRMSATTAYNLLRNYVGRQSGTSRHASVTAEERFDKDAADELADLIRAFGDRQSNPLAFSSLSLRAIAGAARVVFRDRIPAPQDQDRWMKHMVKFPFANYQYLRSAKDLQEQLIKWWNKHLSPARKITIL